MKRIILLIFGLFICGFFHSANAAYIFGKVKSSDGNNLAFANVFIDGTGTGTTSNEEGFYQLELSPGVYNIVFRFIGYKTEIIQVSIADKNVRLDVDLQSEAFLLRDVVINANNEDPAYPIIRNAIERRQKHLEETQSYSCKVYIKGLQKFLAIPKRVGGLKVKMGDMVDTASGIGYLSETVSRLYYNYPNETKEEIISSRVSGNNRAFSFNRASDLMFNPYQNLIELGGISNRPFISPISDQAFVYYTYRLVGNFEDHGRLIYKIAVIPKREFDPVFRGYIFIEETDYHVLETDLFLTKQTRMEILDTLRLKQTFSPVSKDHWLPLSFNLSFRFSILGFEGDGYFHAVYSDYNLGTINKLKNKSAEKVIIQSEANKKDSIYWETIRPVPLTHLESRDYIKRDSISERKEIPEVKDSLRHVYNKPSLGKVLLGGYNIKLRNEKREIRIKAVLPSISFNTIQGYKATLDAKYKTEYRENKSWAFNPVLNIGTVDQKLNYNLGFELSPEPKHFSKVKISGGSYYTQFNPSNPVSDFKSLYSTLLAESNSQKLYRSDFVTIEGGRELFNGFRANLSLSTANRSPLINNTSHTWIDNPDKFYTSNDPLDAGNQTFSFSKNRSTESNLYINYKFNQQYESVGDIKRILSNDGPSIGIGIRSGWRGVLDGETEFSELYGDISGNLNLKMLGSGLWFLKAGYFINNDAMEFMDFHHIRSHKNNFDPVKFMTLKYYQNSTNDQYQEFHYEHFFKGFVWNKIPFLRILKMNEIAGIHILRTEKRDLYIELTAGLEKLNLRGDLVLGLEKGNKPIFGIKLDAKLP